MKKTAKICAIALALTMAMATTALAADTSSACYPTSIITSEDGAELKKIYDLSPEEDPAGISRSTFELNGYTYQLSEILKQELPEYEEREHTETITVESKSKDMASVLALLPQEREFITDDGFIGTLTLKLDTVNVEVAGYGSTTKDITAKRSYPNLAEQDTEFIPKTIEDGGKTMTLQSIDWQTDNTESVDGYALGNRFTAIATYSTKSTSNYVKGYLVTADYSGTVSHIALDRIRYVAIFTGTPLQPAIDRSMEAAELSAFPWKYAMIPLAVVVFTGAVAGVALFRKHRKENEVVIVEEAENE